ETPPATAIQVSVLVSASAATGFLGFLSGGGFFRMVTASVNTPALMVAVGLTYLVFVFFLWRIAFWGRHPDRLKQIGVRALLVPVVLILAALSMFWTGSFSGNIVPSLTDRVMFSALDWASRMVFDRGMTNPPSS